MEHSIEPGGRGGTLALIAARPGRMRESLQALLAAMPRIGAVDVADDGAAVLHRMTEKRPALLLLDTNLPDRSACKVLRRVKSRWPEARCLALVESVQQREIAQAAGADGVLVKGFSTAELYVMIDELLACQAGDSSQGAEAGQGLAATPAADSAGAMDGGTG